MMQEVRELCVTPDPTLVLVRGLAVPLPTHLPANVPGKTSKDNLSALLPDILI